MTKIGDNMKDKIKSLIQYMLISYMIIIMILTIVNMITIKKTLELTDSSENMVKINEFKKEINDLQDSSCKTLLNEMIKAYEKTSFDGIVKYKDIYDIYWNGTSFLSFYEDIIQDCNISKEKMQSMNMPYYVLNSTSFVDNLISKKMFDYEIGIKDKFFRESAETNRIGLDYKLSKQSEIIMIENILKTIGGNINE